MIGNPFTKFLNITLGLTVKPFFGTALTLIAANEKNKAAKKAARRQSEAAEKAAEQAKFDPYNINMQGLGSAKFGDGTVSTTLDPRLASLAGSQIGRAEALLGQPVQATQTDPRLFGLGSGALGAAGGFLQGAQAQQPQGFGLMGEGALAARGLFGQTEGLNVAGAGRGFLDQLNVYDPQAATQQRFGQLEEMLAPSRQRAREALESRLLRQGRLGSTGGGVQQEALETSIRQQQLQNLLSSSGESRAQQQQLLGLGTGLGQQEAARLGALTGAGGAQGGFFGQLGGQVQQAGMGQQAQQAALFGSMLGAGADVQGLRSAEDYKQLQLEQAYQQAGLGALSTGQSLYRSPLDLASFGAQLGGRQAQAGAQAGALNLQGTTAGTAALLGGAAGQAQALGKVGTALGDYFNKGTEEPNYGSIGAGALGGIS